MLDSYLSEPTSTIQLLTLLCAIFPLHKHDRWNNLDTEIDFKQNNEFGDHKSLLNIKVQEVLEYNRKVKKMLLINCGL